MCNQKKKARVAKTATKSSVPNRPYIGKQEVRWNETGTHACPMNQVQVPASTELPLDHEGVAFKE